ncbi:hypothetical protein [Endozoicomonas sp. 8E]|uniref:hypothetical protein n=1 Tax=Endozoicomonas sp. 8E TaxID=3035692 RepID=UPI0029394302|nr:hypothetical protein [Endozoicomonas sp. 8E]WOG25708.1 hypothetical protein P6910_14095 [Endozoicomonas sp. 8E]
MNVQTGHASGYQSEPGYSEPEIRFLGLYAGFKANNFHLKLGNHYHVIHDVGTPEKLSLFFKNQWLSHLPWFLLAKLLPPSTVPYPSFSRGFPSLSRAFNDAPDCNPHPVMIDHSLLKGRLSVQTACIENHPVWQITASPPTSSSETQAVKGDSLSAWLSLWKLLNDTNTSTLFLRPWREDQLNRLQAIICQTNPLTEHKKCQSVLIDFPLNHAKPWLLHELAKKDIISADGQTALDSHSIKRVNQAIDCLYSHDKLFGEPIKSKPAGKEKIHACQNNHWLYQWSDQSWLYQPGIPETAIKPSPALMTGKYFNLWALEKVSPGNDTHPPWSRSSLFIARNDRHRKYHFWGAGDPVLVMGFADAPYNVEDHYAGWDGPVIGTLVESEHLNLAALLMNTATSTPFNFYQWRGILSGFTAPIPKSLSARVREQILSDPGSLYQFVKRRPELLSNVLTYLNREFPGHPVNSYFFGRVSPFFSHQTNANPLALVPETSNVFDGFHPPAIPHQRDMSLPSTRFTSGIMTASGVQGNNGPPESQSCPSYPSAQKAEQSGNKSKRTASPDGRNNIDDNEPPPPDGNHPVTQTNETASESLLKHLLHFYRHCGLWPGRVIHGSDFLPELLDIKSSENFETLVRQCQSPDCESEALYNQMLRGFDPKNQQHRVLASKALHNSILAIVPDGQKYRCYSHDINRDHRTRQPLEGLEDIHTFLFHENLAVRLFDHSDNNLWFTHFLIRSQLNEKENKWLQDSEFDNALWELFPQWQKDILLCRESLQSNAIKSTSEELKEASIKSASQALKQAFNAPDKFMQEKHGQNLFRFYNKLGLVCYPFDDTEDPDGTLYISSNVLGAVVFFWEDSASNYIAFIAPDLSTSTINNEMQSLDNHLKSCSEGALLVKKQDIRYVIPALLVLAPVFRKTYTEIERVLSDTGDALVYGGLARSQHLSSLVKPTELGKAPVTNDIDLAVRDIKNLETIAASLEKKLRSALSGTIVRRSNIHTMVLANPKELQRRRRRNTVKINCSPDKNNEKTMGLSDSKAKKWRILSIDISAGPEGYFDFIRVEPYARGSKLLMPSLPALVEKLLQDTQLDQTYPGTDATKRRRQNAQNALKILLASDNQQQVEEIIRQSLFSRYSKSSRLPEFLIPYIKPQPDNVQESTIKVENKIENGANDQRPTIAHNSKPVAPVLAEGSKKRKTETAAKKSISDTIDFKTALSQSIEISNWLKEMDYNLPGELNRATKAHDCGDSEENEAPEEKPASDTELDTLQNQLKEGKAITLQILACSGASADTSGDQPVITINMANTPDSQQRSRLKQAAYENHFPYAQLIQALFILNQKIPPGKPEALQIYENAFELLLPAALAGIPLAYQLLIAMQLHNQHPAGWPQMEPVNRLLRSKVSRQTSFNQVKVEGLMNGGFLEQLYQDTDVTTLTRIEQGLAKESELSDRGKEAKAILSALREPDNPSILTALKAVRPGTRELQQSIGSLILILERKKEPAVGQIHSELWSYSLNALKIKGDSKKKSQVIDISCFPYVLAMTDLKAFMDTEPIGQLLKHHQPRFIAFWKVGFWESYLKASLSKNSKTEKEIFDEHQDKISNKAIKKSRSDLKKDWILARSFLLSRDFIQIKKVPASPTPSTLRQLSSGAGTNSAKTKRTVNAARKPTELKPAIRPSTGPFNERLHTQYLFQLDNNIIQEVRFMQENPKKFLQQVEDHITTFRKALVKNSNDSTNKLGIGYYYFLKALAMIGAKMSDDNRTIELSFSPEAKLNANKIRESILVSRDLNFPYASMLFLFFQHGMGGKPNSAMQAYCSAFSGVSQSIEILLESRADTPVLAGLLLKWLALIPKPFALKLAFDADTYLKNPQGEIPGRVTPSIHVLREFLEQLPVKGSDGAVDVVLNRLGQLFTDTRYLLDEQHEKEESAESASAAAIETAKAAEEAIVEVAIAVGVAVTNENDNDNEIANEIVKVKANAKEKAMALAKATIKVTLKAKSNATALEKSTAVVAAISKLADTGKAAASTIIEMLTDEKAKAVEEAVEEALDDTLRETIVEAAERTEAALRLILYFATDRTELIDFICLDLSILTIIFSIIRPELNSELPAYLKKAQRNLSEDTEPENRAMADIIELAFHLVGALPEAELALPHLKAQPFDTQALLTAMHFGHDLQLLKKLIGLSRELVAEDTKSFYNIILLVHQHILTLIGENAEKAKKLQFESDAWKILRNGLKNFVWHKPVKTATHNMDSNVMNNVVFNSNSVKKFWNGDESTFILATEQAIKIGYQKLKQQLNQYEGKLDYQSLQMSGWLHCLAGLTLLEAKISSDHQKIILTGRKSVLASAHNHFMKAREIGFHYGGYLESLVFMRLANHYQYYQDETSEAWQKDSIYKPVIQYTSTKRPGEKIFIEAGKIVTEILPGLLASSLLGVRFSAETAIRIFTDKRFNLLHIPQAGWPAMLTKYLLICPANYRIQFLFSNDGFETENALFPRTNDPDSIEGILLKPLEKTRQLTIGDRPEYYGIFLDSEINNGDRPESIKKYLSLVKAFVLDKSDLLDTPYEATDSDSDQLSESIASYKLSRFDYKKLLEEVQETPQPETGLDEFVYNLPKLGSHPNYEAISNALLKKHRKKSALIHYYLWAYETLNENFENERDLFWNEIMTKKIEENETMKKTFLTLLATADLTAMYDDTREAMVNTFEEYNIDLSTWLAFLHSISATSALFLGEKQKADFHFDRFENLKGM